MSATQSGGEVTRRDPAWLCTIDGISDRLAEGATGADLGCGTGRWTVELARAFRHSSFVGIDEDAARVAAARALALRAGVQRRTRFEVGTAAELSGCGYDLVTVLDSRTVHRLTPEAACCLRTSLVVDGRLLAVTPIAAVPTGPERLAGLLHDSGFRHVQVVARTSLDLVLEARP
jgi:SAM-dependent methyltransferase